MMKIALIFPIHNKLEYTKKGLTDIYSCFQPETPDSIPIDIVITDDGSTDGSYDWIKTNYPKIHLVKGDGSLWWSGGINKAVGYVLEKLEAEYILLWNNDIRPENRYFENLFKILADNEPETIICSKIYIENKNNFVLSLGGIFNPKTGKYALNGYGAKDDLSDNKPVEVDWFPGMGTCISRKIFTILGLFDEKNFPQYHGDSDFGLRARKEGFKIIAYPQLRIWNDRSNTGYSNNASFKTFIRSMFTLKSNFNISKDIRFYRRHAAGIFAYRFLIKKYFRHIGGYFKWSILQIFGFRRNTM